MKRFPPAPQLDRLVDANQSLVKQAVEGMYSVSDSNYLHWEELRHKKPSYPFAEPLGWWLALKLKRAGASTAYEELRGFGVQSMRLTRHANMDASLAKLDRGLAGEIAHHDAPINSQTRDQYVSSSLMEEAIHSSMFEGAVSTREIAKDMLREGRPPVNVHERMILNNHKAMLRLSEMAKEPLSFDSIMELHSILVDQTLEKPDQAGRIQSVNEQRIAIWDDRSNSIVHNPPPAEELPERMERLVAFANGEDIEGERYTHPVIRSILIHFQLAFDHPFADGNGRTARALFYWSMLRHGYWLTEFISISRLIYKHPEPYRSAFLLVESDAQDVSYFVRHQLAVLEKAVEDLNGYIILKRRQVDEVRTIVHRRIDLNQRQLALLQHALRHSNAIYTHESHANSHRVSNLTANNDMKELVQLGFLVQAKRSKAFVYRPVKNLLSKLKRS